MAKDYNFGEKKIETINGVECPVWQTPKYLEAKKKVIETLESEKYKGILSESDFWILINTYSNKTKAMYSGLIISHNGCLKINDTLDNKVKPECFRIDKEGYNDSLVVSYVDNDVCEFGEVSIKNCKNEYPYAMAYKRCFDRVVLKKCKLAYAGIYSDSEAEEFSQKPHETEENLEKKETKGKERKEIKIHPTQIDILNKYYVGENMDKLLKANGLSKLEDMTMVKASEIIKKLQEVAKKEEDK